MKIKVSEASGKVLEYLVAIARGFVVYHNATLNGCVMEGFWVSGYYPGDSNSWVSLNVLKHSTSWALGGPIIEQELIEILLSPKGHVRAIVNRFDLSRKVIVQHGPTPLIAAMRCLVVSKMGYEVEVPDDLV